MTSFQLNYQHALKQNTRDVMRAGLARPSTPSFRIVTACAVNPSPTFVDEEEELLFGDVLSPHKLRQLTGCVDLERVLTLDLTVDTTESSLGSLGTYLPNLTELRLSGSHITTVRDLGTTLRSLKVLWMSRCGLQDLDGISSIGLLRELYLSYNQICDISPLSMVDTLQLVDIESNNVGSLDQVEFLCMCPALTTLCLEGNPVSCGLERAELRGRVRELLPQLRYLDDIPVRGGEATPPGDSGSLDKEMRVVSSSLKETLSDVYNNRPSTAVSHREADTPSPTPVSAPTHTLAVDHSSGLTQGAILCGPASKLKSKAKRAVADTPLSATLVGADTPPPATLVGAWSEHPDDMIREWSESREWLTRELTQNSVDEERHAGEKRDNYEAALRATSRPSSSSSSQLSPPQNSSSQLSPPQNSSSQLSPPQNSSSQLSPPQNSSFLIQNIDKRKSRDAGKSCDTNKSRDVIKSRDGNKAGSSGKSRVRNADGSRMPHYDESVEVTKRRSSTSRSRDKSVEISRDVSKPRYKTRDKTRGDPEAHGSRDLEPIEPTTRRNSGGTRTYKSNSSSFEFPRRHSEHRRADERSIKSLDSGLCGQPTSPVRAIYRPADLKKQQIRTLPSPPARCSLPSPPAGGKAMSTRFRRLKVSIEEQVGQQATVDVLFNESMPKPGISRHTEASPYF